jgi:hypothetical protein
MKELAIVVVMCAAACTPKPAFVDTGNTPVATCGATFNCAEGGGDSTLLVPFGVLLAATVSIAIAMYTLDSLRSQPHAVQP